jgi:predicted nucleic-acid-binding protein
MKETKYFIDTNIFLRAIVKDDTKIARNCERLFKRIKQGEIKAVTSSLVLAEIQWTLKSFYKVEKKDSTVILDGIVRLKNLRIENKENSLKAIELYKKHNIKFVDTLIASRADVLNKKLTIISFDKDFDKIKVLRKEPKDLL